MMPEYGGELLDNLAEPISEIFFLSPVDKEELINWN